MVFCPELQDILQSLRGEPSVGERIEKDELESCGLRNLSLSVKKGSEERQRQQNRWEKNKPMCANWEGDNGDVPSLAEQRKFGFS